MRKFIFVFCFLWSGFVFAQATQPTSTLFLTKTKKTTPMTNVKKSLPQGAAVSSKAKLEIAQKEKDIRQLNQTVSDLKKQHENSLLQQQQLLAKIDELSKQNIYLTDQLNQAMGSIQLLTEKIRVSNWRHGFLTLSSKLADANIRTWLIISGVLLVLLLVLLQINHSFFMDQQKNKREGLNETDNFSDKKINYNNIAGEDTMTSQLDLARAYIEMEDYDHAKNILESVLKSGSKEQKRIAQELMVQVK